MELFRLEHKKLWRKKIVKICVLLCFVYVVVFGSILSFQWFGFGSTGDYESSSFGNRFDGYTVIRNSQEYAHSFGGELSDKTLQKLVGDYQKIDASDMEKQLQKTDKFAVNSWLTMLYPELQETSEDIAMSNWMISYVNPNQLTGFYEKRQQTIEDFLELNNQTGKEKDYLMHLEQKVEKPFSYEWVEGWSQLLGSMLSELKVVLALFLAIALSSLFAGEWHDNTGALVLTTKNGWEKIARAKILAGLAFTVELFTICAVFCIISQLFFLGTDGWDMPVQNIKVIAVAPMNMLQAEIYEYTFSLLGAVGYAGIVMLLSAAVKNNVIALLLSLAVGYGPMVISDYLPFGLQKALDLIPLAGSPTDIFRTNTFHIFGKIIWSPYLLVTVPVLIGIFCLPFAVKGWAKRMKV